MASFVLFKLCLLNLFEKISASLAGRSTCLLGFSPPWWSPSESALCLPLSLTSHTAGRPGAVLVPPPARISCGSDPELRRILLPLPWVPRYLPPTSRPSRPGPARTAASLSLTKHLKSPYQHPTAPCVTCTAHPGPSCHPATVPPPPPVSSRSRCSFSAGGQPWHRSPRGAFLLVQRAPLGLPVPAHRLGPAPTAALAAAL